MNRASAVAIQGQQHHPKAAGYGQLLLVLRLLLLLVVVVVPVGWCHMALMCAVFSVVEVVRWIGGDDDDDVNESSVAVRVE